MSILSLLTRKEFPMMFKSVASVILLGILGAVVLSGSDTKTPQVIEDIKVQEIIFEEPIYITPTNTKP